VSAHSRSLRVLRTGPQLLVQDLGRPGWAHLGVPASGALDPQSLALANRLVGNPEGSAGLEILMGGCALVAERSLRVALTGAGLTLRVDGNPRGWGEPVSVRAGQQLDIGASPDGLRAWLAVAGGVAVPRVLGSRSTDTLTGLGPAPVHDGDRLRIGLPGDGVGHGAAVPEPRLPTPCPMRCWPGPRAGWFSDAARAALFTERYAVSPDSNRVGLRLQSPSTLERRIVSELPSEGVVRGAVQVPASGQPLVFLADHPVTGGYPVIAVVEPADLRRCAQLRPGDEVVFVDGSPAVGEDDDD
jgi:biotin-dependent carboxylase-like uncharacterized protein